MTPRILHALAVPAGAVAFAGAVGCSSAGGGAVPAPPTPMPAPTPSAPPEPPEEDRPLPFVWAGAFFLPNRTLEVSEGQTVAFEIQTFFGRDYTGGGERPGIPIGIASDAPEDRLSVPTQVRVGGYYEPGIVEITAGSAGGEVSDEYRIWLTESPELNLAPGFVLALDPTPIRVRVRRAETPTAPRCIPPDVAVEPDASPKAGGAMATSVFGYDGLSWWSGDWTLRVPAGTAVTLAAPYRKPFAGEPEAARLGEGLSPRPALLASAFGIVETASGLVEQTMRLGWFADLRLIVESPGCEPVEAACVEGRCSVR